MLTLAAAVSVVTMVFKACRHVVARVDQVLAHVSSQIDETMALLQATIKDVDSAVLEIGSDVDYLVGSVVGPVVNLVDAGKACIDDINATNKNLNAVVQAVELKPLRDGIKWTLGTCFTGFRKPKR